MIYLQHRVAFQQHLLLSLLVLPGYDGRTARVKSAGVIQQVLLAPLPAHQLHCLHSRNHIPVCKLVSTNNQIAIDRIRNVPVVLSVMRSGVRSGHVACFHPYTRKNCPLKPVVR